MQTTPAPAPGADERGYLPFVYAYGSAQGERLLIKRLLDHILDGRIGDGDIVDRQIR